jgi:hypothetical protein
MSHRFEISQLTSTSRFYLRYKKNILSIQPGHILYLDPIFWQLVHNLEIGVEGHELNAAGI